MVFADSKILLALWLIPIAVGISVFGFRKVRARLELFTKTRLGDLSGIQFKRRRAWFKSILIGLTLASIIIALAKPRWGFEWKEVPRGGVDIMVVLDLSTSMLATDISPTRLERSKREIIDLLDMLEGDRIGIVAFAGVAFVQCPLTVDYRITSMFVSQIRHDLMPVQGTALGKGIELAVNSLEKSSTADSEGKAIILITDGEDHGTNPLGAAAKAKEKGIRIFSIGIGGEEGAPIPLPNGGFKKDRKGDLIISKLDEKTLQDISLKTGGIYVRSATGDFDLDTIYRNGIRKDVTDRDYGVSRQKIWHERFQIFLLIGILLLLLEYFTSLYASVRKRKLKSGIKPHASTGKKLLTTAIALATLWGLDDKAYADTAKEATKLFEQKEFSKASEKFLEAEVETPDNLQNTYNRAVSQFKAGNYDGAIQGFSNAAQSKDPKTSQKSLFNLGNSFVAKGQLEQAAKVYEKVIEADPKDQKSKENLAWVKKKIKKQKKQDQQKQDQQKQDQQKQDQQKQDQQKQDQQKQDQQKQDQQKQDQQKQDQQKQDQQKQDQQKQDQADAKNDTKEEQQKEEQQAMSKEEQMEKEAAERLLRSLEAQEQVYGMPPKVSKPKNPPARDW